MPTFQKFPPQQIDRTDWPWSEVSAQMPEKMLDGTDWPRISVVTPSYNQGEFIEETIRSVLLQGYPNLEYIIIDGSSTDNSVEIIKKYEPWLTYWVSEVDDGQAHAINKGFKYATGDIYAYINSDDIYYPEILARVSKDFIQNKNNECYWATYPVEKSGNNEAVVMLDNVELSLLEYVRNRVGLHQPGTFWAKKLYRELGGFDEELDYVFDRKFFMELIARNHFPVQLTGIVASRFRIHASSKTYTEGEKGTSSNQFNQENSLVSREYIDRLVGADRKIYRRKQRQWKMSELLEDMQGLRASKKEGVIGFMLVIKEYPSAVFTRFYWGALFELLRTHRR